MMARGDFEASNREPCVTQVTTFVGCILFSIETQQTCTSGLFVLMIQTWLDLIIQSVWMGIVYMKLARPKRRRHTLIWSRKAAISRRNNYWMLQVRLGDIRHQSPLLEAHVRMYFVAKNVRQEQ